MILHPRRQSLPNDAVPTEPESGVQRAVKRAAQAKKEIPRPSAAHFCLAETVYYYILFPIPMCGVFLFNFLPKTKGAERKINNARNAAHLFVNCLVCVARRDESETESRRRLGNENLTALALGRICAPSGDGMGNLFN